MSHRISCPHCQATLKSAEAPPAGKRVKCPKCGKAFSYDPASSSTSEVAARPKHREPTAAPAEMPSGRGMGMIVLAIGLLVGSVLAGGVYWLMTSKGRSGDPIIAVKNGEMSRPAVGPENQPDNNRQAAQPQPREEAHAVKNEQAPHPVVAEGRAAAENDLTLPTSFKSEGPIRVLTFAPDGSLLAAANGDGITLFELGTGQIYRTIPFRSNQSVHVAFAPNQLAVAAATEGQCSVWQVSDGKELAAFHANESDFNPTQPLFAFSPAGTQMAVTDAEHGIHVWDLEQGREQCILKSHKARVQDLVFTPDGKSIVSVSSDNDGTVRLWNLAKPAEGRLLIEGQPITRLVMTSDGKTLFTGPTVMQWDISGGGPATSLGKMSDRAAFAESLQLLPDDKTLAVISRNQVVLWDIPGHQVRHQKEFPLLEGFADLKQLVISPDGQTTALAAETVQLWDLASGQMRGRFKEDRSKFRPERVAFSADNAVLAVGFPDGLINLLPASSAAAGSSIAAAKAVLSHDSPVGDLAFTPDGESLIVELLPPLFDPKDPSVHPDFEAIVKANKEQSEKLGRQASVELRMKVLGELNEKLFRNLYDKLETKFHWGDVAAVWNVNNGKERGRLRQPPWHGSELRSLDGVEENDNGSKYELGESHHRVSTATIGGGRVAWLNRLTGVELYNVSSEQQSHFDRIQGRVDAWQLSPDGQVLLIAHSELDPVTGAPKTSDHFLIDLATRRTTPLQLKSPGPLGAEQFCFAPDGVTFAAALAQPDGAYTIQVWDVATGRQPTVPLSIASNKPHRLTISSDGQLLAFIDDKVAVGTLHVVDLITGKERAVVVPTPVAMPTFAPDSQTLALTTKKGDRQLILLVDLKVGQIRTRITDFMTENIRKLLFSPDGKTLAVVSGNPDRSRSTYFKRQDVADRQQNSSPGELKLFDVATGKLRSALGGHTSAIRDIAYSPDGRLLASSGWDRTVRLWDVESVQAAPAIAKVRAPRPPTKALLVAVVNNAAPATPPDATPSAAPDSPPAARPEQSHVQPTGKSGMAPAATITGMKTEKNSIGMELVVLPSGEFLMGSSETDPNAEPNERPAHLVKVSRPFAIGAHEVTVGQFRAFVKSTGYQTDDEKNGTGSTGYDADSRTVVDERQPRFNWQKIGVDQTERHPVVNVSWNDAGAFCTWLSGKEGAIYRLPTEAEWEYACRSGTKTRYPTGDEGASLKGKANVGDVSLNKSWPAASWVTDWDDGHPFTCPVGSYAPNAWGIYDMVGNAAEWTADWYAADFYQNSPDVDPKGPQTGEFRVLRGGCWFNEPRHQRSAIRFPDWVPSAGNMLVGFRVVREQ